MKNIERVSVKSISADPANVRLHPDKNIDAIKASLRRFGQQKPIVVDANGVVRAGNGTLAAAVALGWDKIDVVRTELNGSEATAYAIADNRSSELAEWDRDLLVEQLVSLRDDDDIELSELGFDESDIIEMTTFPESANGKEFDESAADDVEYIICPKCDHKWPK